MPKRSTETLIEVRVRLWLKPSTVKRIEKISAVERRRPKETMAKAVEEIADRGYTDIVEVKGEIG